MQRLAAGGRLIFDICQSISYFYSPDVLPVAEPTDTMAFFDVGE